MIRRLFSVIAGLAMVLVLAPAAFAQAVSGAHLSGVVSDPSGGALPGVDVTATQTATGATRSSVTGSNGGYVFNNLPIGPYKITVKLNGFSTFEQTGIVLAVGESRSVNVALKLGAMSETVSVSASATLVETSKVSVANVIDQQMIEALPLASRQVTQLLTLSGAAVNDEAGGGPGGSITDDRQPPNAVAISVAGGAPNSTLYLVDGGYNNDPQANTGNAMPFPDALQEFSVESGVRDARFGQSTGATVNAVTKSGTNTFHGNVFEYLRDAKFNSISYFAKKENGGTGLKDGLKRAQTGGTFGGPIVKDKLFIFGGLQVTNSRITPNDNTTIVPTAAVRAGDFTQIMSAACRGTARTLGAPFVNNKVNAALYHPISLKIMNLLPLPDASYDPDGCGRYNNIIANNTDDYQVVLRSDYQVSTNKRVFFRYYVSHSTRPTQFDQANPNLLKAAGNGAGRTSFQKTLASGLDYVLSPNLFSSTRFSYADTSSLRLQGNGVPTWATLGVKAWIWTNGADQRDYLGGGTAGWSGAGSTGYFNAYTPSLSQDFDWIKGQHSLSFGGSWTRPHDDGDCSCVGGNGTMGFTGQVTRGATTNDQLNMADFVLGYPFSYNNGGSQLNDALMHSVGLYMGDVWRVSRRLTMNYGLRWEPYLAAKDVNGFNMAFDRNGFVNNVHSSVAPKSPAGLVFPGDSGFPTGGTNNVNKLNQFSPRLGVVWDPMGDNKQTIRAGIGRYYNMPALWTTASQPTNPPYGNRTNALRPGEAGATLSCNATVFKNGCPLDFFDPWSAYPGGDPHASYSHLTDGGPVLRGNPATAVYPVNGTYTVMPIDFRPAQQVNWNVSYQRQLPARVAVEVSYLGNISRNTFLGYNENPAIYIPGNCVAGQYGLTAAGPCSNTNNTASRALLTLINPDQGKFYNVNGVSQGWDQGRGHYNGMKLNVTKRMSNGWSVNSNYTLSKCINQGEPSTNIGNQFPDPLTDAAFPLNLDPSGSHPNPSSNEGRCTSDRKHIFNLSSVLVSPGLGFGGRLVKIVTKDWQVGFIFQARSGSPITVSSASDASLVGVAKRAELVPGVDPYLGTHDWIPNAAGVNTQLTWFNPAAFTTATLGTWGNTPKGFLTGPSFWNVDASFSRNINLSRSRRVELRIEAFNLTNHVAWANPAISAGSTNANNGRVTNTSGDARTMQFSAKYGF